MCERSHSNFCDHSIQDYDLKFLIEKERVLLHEIYRMGSILCYAVPNDVRFMGYFNNI